MDKITIYDESFDARKIALLCKECGLEQYLSERKPLPKSFVRNFPFLYRQLFGYKRLVAFLHIPKTAGAALTGMVLDCGQFAIYKGIFSEHLLDFEAQVHTMLGFQSEVEAGKEVFLCGHYNYLEFMQRGGCQWPSDEILICIRSPKEIIRSTYNFIGTQLERNPQSVDSVIWKNIYGNNFSQGSLLNWLSHVESQSVYIRPYHQYLGLDDEANIDERIADCLKNNVTVVRSSQLNEWVVESAFGRELVGRVPPRTENQSRAIATAFPDEGLLSVAFLALLRREERIFSLLDSWHASTSTRSRNLS